MSRSSALWFDLLRKVTAPVLLLAVLTFVTASTAVALSEGDCFAVGGKVITVTDGRCGASGKYCRLPDTNAICIAKLGTIQTVPATKVQPKMLPKGNIQRAK